MPGGKVHSAITIATALGVIAPYAVVNLQGDPYLYIAGNLTGLLLTPDLDVDAGNISDTMIRRVSPTAQWFWRKFWTPYSLALPHRSTLSHAPIISTAIRLGYILVGINLIKLLWWLLPFDDTSSFVWFWNWSFFWGLVHVDTCHWLADRFIKGKEQFIDE
jgi:uncharacterized metal-binding protein